MGIPTDRCQKSLLWDNTQTDPDEYDLHIYTDGSKEQDTGYGWAACVENTCIHTEIGYLGADATVYQAEAVALLNSIKWVGKSTYKNILI